MTVSRGTSFVRPSVSFTILKLSIRWLFKILKNLPDKWLFTFAAVDNCVHEPCQNGATCVNGTGGVPYNCTCVPGWDGPNCDMSNFSFLQLFLVQCISILSELRHLVGWFLLNSVLSRGSSDVHFELNFVVYISYTICFGFSKRCFATFG